jgi:prepilin-type N-terminal cleavage/methylation domain-containing protein
VRATVRSQSGFTLVEVLVTVLMVTLISTAVAVALIGNAHVTGQTRDQSEADALAQQDQERLKGMSSEQLSAIENQTRTVTLGATGASGAVTSAAGTTFTVTSNAEFVNSSGTASCGASGTSGADYYEVSSQVTWAGNGGSPIVEKSIATPPVGGILVVRVENQLGSGLSGVTVAATGPDYASGTTDANGCVILAGLEEGSYTVTSTDVGYIDAAGVTSPITETATLTDSGSATPSGGNPLDMGQAGLVNAHFVTCYSTCTLPSGSGTVTGQEADAFSWYGAGSSAQMSAPMDYNPSTTPVTTLPSSGSVSLFPFAYSGPSYANNYQVWAGKCPQMQPPAGMDDASVGPATTQTLTIAEPALDVNVTFGGTRIVPAHVKLTFTSGAGSGTACTDTWQAAVASNAATSSTGALAFPGQPFASTATSGSTESASKGTGSYSVCADYTSGRNTYHDIVPGVQNTNFGAITTVNVPITTGTGSGTC